MLSKITTNLVVPNVNSALDFYERILGFGLVMAVPAGSQEIVTAHVDDTPLAFAIIKRDDVELMLQSRESLLQELPALKRQPGSGVSITLYIRVADVRELHETIRRNVTILKDLHTTFYGTEEFCILDSNGYVLTFAGNPKEP
ncbi:MAG: VOC family protein [Sedimentisphaerales bacterium]|nr:VOC family protein [Sedimentisphaerales bacterium]